MSRTKVSVINKKIRKRLRLKLNRLLKEKKIRTTAQCLEDRSETYAPDIHGDFVADMAFHVVLRDLTLICCECETINIFKNFCEREHVLMLEKNIIVQYLAYRKCCRYTEIRANII